MDITNVFEEIDAQRLKYERERAKAELKGDIEVAKNIWIMRMALDVLKGKLKEKMEAA